MGAPTTLAGHIMSQTPLPVAWVTWLMSVNTAALLFVSRRVAARRVLAAWAAHALPGHGSVPGDR
ncbi:MAG: hypothetical protein FJ148_10025 [Deltaproteobacteria bacterium]|nr:hypothetical protein [Deltaproteobacteria bacterium]